METVNYFNGNPVNRLSYLRHSSAFLSSALSSDKARFLLYSNLNPLCDTKSMDSAIVLRTVSWSDVKSHIPMADSLFDLVDDKDEKAAAQGGAFWQPDGEKGGDKSAEASLAEKKRHYVRQPALVFLGVDERSAPEAEQSLPVSKPTDESTLETHSPYGVPLWALDVSELDHLREWAIKLSDGLTYQDLRAGMSSIPGEDAAIAGQGRALIDWNKRHIFCSGCGRPTRSVWAGWKRACVPDLPGDPDVGSKPACFSKKGVHNFSYPRTDPVVIMAILDPSREKILLGRQRVWPSKFYSTLAGFIELGESIEEAVRREVYEEAGVRVAEVFYHSSQNWPFPASLMIGCIGIADEGQQIRTDLDNELEDARWFTKADVLVALGQDMTMTKEDHARMIQNQVQDEDKDKREDIQIRLPPATAIAHTLIAAWAKGEDAFSHSARM